MIIKEIAFGNTEEAFIEKRFENKVNIIFSNENNRGKTLLMQSLIYSIGYESIFPSGFETKKYYFYSKIEFRKETFEFLRRGNSILVINGENFNFHNSITEFKYYFDDKIYKLPRIDKNGELKTVDLSLFYEIFFLGQDKRNTSNIIIKGQNNKNDFLNMLYSMVGVFITNSNKYDIESLKKEKKNLESRIKAETRKISIINKNPEIANFITATSNKNDFQNTSKQLNELHNSIAELKKKRNREENRKIKLDNLIIELNSLNRNLNEGKVKCSECGSSKIIFSNDDFDFEVSNSYVRKHIIDAIRESISVKKEIITEYNTEIEKEQDQINKLLKTSTPEVKNYILFQDEIFDSAEIDKAVLGLKLKLEEIELNLQNNETQTFSNKELQRDLIISILKEMERLYNIIDPHGLLVFDDIFTKAGETYSGSEGQEYYFCKLLALNNILLHNFPLIIDSFREGELSSTKESLMIGEFKKLNKQIILTSTLKKEEYNNDKYYQIDDINVIDYSNIEDSKILQKSYVEDFKNIISKFKITE